MKRNTDTDTDIVETLANNMPTEDVVTSDVMVQARLALEAETRTKRLEESKVRLKSAIEDVLVNVQVLRELRARERVQKAFVTALSDAAHAYQNDGNWTAYQRARVQAQQDYNKNLRAALMAVESAGRR